MFYCSLIHSYDLHIGVFYGPQLFALIIFVYLHFITFKFHHDFFFSLLCFSFFPPPPPPPPRPPFSLILTVSEEEQEEDPTKYRFSGDGRREKRKGERTERECGGGGGWL